MPQPKVLIIEDSLSDAHIIGRIAGELAETRRVSTLPAAIQELSGTQYSVVLLDLALPGTAPENAMAELSDAGYAGHVIVVTVSDDARLREEAASRGYVWVSKDSSEFTGELHRAIASAISRGTETQPVGHSEHGMVLASLSRMEKTVRVLSADVTEIKAVMKGEEPSRIGGVRKRGCVERCDEFEALLSRGRTAGWNTARYIAAAIGGGALTGIGYAAKALFAK